MGLEPRPDLVEGDIQLMGHDDPWRLRNAVISTWPNKTVIFDGQLRKFNVPI